MDAIRDFNTALELGWRKPVVYNARGMAQRALGNRAEALDDLTVAVSLDRDESEDAVFAVTNVVRGRERRIGRSAKKIRAAAHARAAGCVADVGGVSGDDTKAVGGRGAHTVLTKPGVMPAAVERNTKFLFNRALLFGDLGDFELAEEDLSASLHISPHDAKLLYHRGRVRFALRAFHDAAEDFREALAHLPQREKAADLHYHLGLAHACNGDHYSAIPCFNRALAAAIPSVESTDESSAPLQCAQKTQSTEQRRAVNDFVAYTHELAKSQQLVGRYSDAIVNFSKVIDSDPGNARAYFRRAFAHKSLQHYDRAAEDFQRASEIEPANPDLIVNYSKLHETDVVVLCDPGK